MGFIEPLDLETIFITLLAGDFTTFMFLAFIVLAILAAIFKMPNAVFGVMGLGFIVFMVASTTQSLGSGMMGFLIIGVIILALWITRTLVNQTR